MNKLFSDLMSLVSGSDGRFHFVDQITNAGMNVRIFDYHIAGYSDWLLPSAQECRGIVFEMNEGSPVQILVRPMAKFYNLSELQGWENMDVVGNMAIPDLNSVYAIMDKRDGSLISTYIDRDGRLGLKSKGSLHSDQAREATAWIYKDENEILRDFCYQMTKIGYTVNMEWTAPNNQIVLIYTQPELKILNIRHRETGEYILPEQVHSKIIDAFYAEFFNIPTGDINEWIEYAYNETGKEGYIMVFRDGQMCKLKTNWYVALHHTKDSIKNDKQLVVCVAENASDDLRQMFVADQGAIEKINRFEAHITGYAMDSTNLIRTAVAQAKGLDRKSFAMRMQSMFRGDNGLFSIAMNMYSTGVQETTVVLNSVLAQIKKYPERYIPKD
jgi:T4 RnlA family RNA ligase